MAIFVPVSTSAAWVKGRTYQIVYDVDHVKLFGTTIPDELLPDAVREYLAKKQITQVIEKMTGDPRYEVVGYEYEGRTFTVSLIARDNPFPVALIVGSIIALAIIFGIALATKEVRQLVDSVDTTVKDIGPVGTNVAIGTVALVAVVGAFLVFRGKFA